MFEGKGAERRRKKNEWRERRTSNDRGEVGGVGRGGRWKKGGGGGGGGGREKE